MPTAEATREEMVRLAEYLRQNPDSLRMPPEAIAAEANASVELVRHAVGGTDTARPARKAKKPPTKFNWARIPDVLFRHPPLFVAVTYIATLVAVRFIDASPAVSTAGSATTIRWDDAVEIALLLVMTVLHMACYAWRGLSRYALIGGAVIGVIGTTAAVASTLVDPAARKAPQLPLYVGAAVVLLALLYVVLGVGCASLGAYVRFRYEDRSMRRRSRQELLARLFEIEEALRSPQASTPSRRWPLVEWVRPRVYWVALGLGAAITLLMSTSTLFFPGPSAEAMMKVEQAQRSLPPDQVEQIRAGAFKSVSAAFFLAQFVFAAVSIMLQLGVAFLGGRPLRSVLISYTYTLGSMAAALVPIGTMGYSWMAGQAAASLISAFVMATLLGLFAGLGAFVEERAHRARRRSANDPAVLLGEFVEIQRLLNSAGQSKCVLVVDAAKSSLMKANADPLVAEWSFRAYQEFLAGIVRDAHGRIHSTAGDGAIAAFDRAADAFHAARTIQTKIAEFNAYVNRLKDPFRLRIGIHCGEVSGNLDEVEFTAVLDVAAHVEAASQVGGIAVTSSVAEQLPDHRFAEIQDSVDGFRVLLALNPTLDPEADENA